MEYNLNDSNNLNPQIKNDELISKWNETPEVKEKGIKAIDTKKRIDIDKRKFDIIIFMAFIGVIGMLIIAGAVCFYCYMLHQDGTMLNPVELVCGNTSIIVPDTNNCPVPVIPACPSLTCPDVTCGNTTYNPVIKIYNISG
jgi:hypothetical protein